MKINLALNEKKGYLINMENVIDWEAKSIADFGAARVDEWLSAVMVGCCDYEDVEWNEDIYNAIFNGEV